MMDMTAAKVFTPAARVAVLIDGENLSSAHADTILGKSALLGEATVRRVYGKPEHIAPWENYGFRLVPAGMTKNAADIALCVDAMTLALREEFSTLVIASSDRDFSPLATQLRELGFLVVGIGCQTARPALRLSYSEFIEIAGRQKTTAPEVICSAGIEKPGTPESHGAAPIAVPAISKVDQTLLTVFSRHGGAENVLTLGRLGHLVKELGISRNDVGGNWAKYLKAHRAFRVEGEGAATLVRLRVYQGFTA